MDWRTGTRLFEGHTTPTGAKFDMYANNSNSLCNTAGKTPYQNGYILAPELVGNSFHPNVTGYWAGAPRLFEDIKKYQH